jgi:molecular chaperone IbpA
MTNDVFSFNGLPSNFSKMFIGSDRMMQTLGRVHEESLKNLPSYPPYNIIKVDENNYVIELAVAGFGKQNIDIEIANSTLVIKGGLTLDQLDPANPFTYLYKGIADRAFTRRFTLADSVEVKNAELMNGMLKLWLENIIPEEKKPKKVDIVDKSEVTKKV